MIIRSLFLEGFGIFRDLELPDLAEHMVIVYGENESGKTTLKEAILTLLFGFPYRQKKKNEQYYPPFRGGNHGGRIQVVLQDGRTLHIERTLRRVRYAFFRDGKNAVFHEFSDGEPLQELWGGRLNRALYRRIFTIDPVDMEMEGLGFLEEDEYLRSLFMASSSGIHPTALVALKNRLYSESQSLIRPRSREGMINQLLDRYRELKRTIHDLERQRARYPELLKERDALEKQLEDIQRKLEERERERQWLELLDRSRTHWTRCQTLEKELQSLEDARAFQEHWWETYQTRVNQLDTLKSKRRETEIQLARAREALGDPPPTPTLEHRETLRALREERAWWRETLERVQDLRARKTWFEKRIQELSHQTGLTLDPSTVAQFPRSPSFAQEARERSLTYRQVHTALQEHRNLRPPHANLLEEHMEEVQQYVEQWHTLNRERQEISHEMDQLKLLLSADGGLPWWSPWIAGLIVGAGLYGFLTLIPSPFPPLPVAITGGGLVGGSLVVVWGLLSLRRRQRQRSIETQWQQRSRKLEELTQQQRALEARLNALGFTPHGHEPSAWTEEDLRILLEHVRNYRLWKEKETQLEERLENLQTQWRAFLEKHQVDLPLRVETYLDLVDPLRNLQGWLDQIQEVERELQQLQNRLETRVNELKRILTSPPSLPPEDPEWIVHLDRLWQKMQEEERHLSQWKQREEKVQSLEETLDALIAEQRRIEEQLNHLYREAGVKDRNGFLELRERYRRWATLHQEWLRHHQSLLALLGSEEALEQASHVLRTTDAVRLHARLQELEREVKELQQEQTRLLERRGELNRSIREMEEERTLQELYQQEIVLSAQIQEGIRAWGRRILALHVLSKAQYIYEQEKQPEIVNRASAYLASITRRAYRLHSPLINPSSIQVEHTENHEFRGEQAWSRGLLEQVLLALRLAFATEFTRMMEGLPILLDEAFAHFDPARMEESARMLADLSRHHQIFFFTCHPELAEMLHATGEQAGRSITRLTLEQGRVIQRQDSPS